MQFTQTSAVMHLKRYIVGIFLKDTHFFLVFRDIFARLGGEQCEFDDQYHGYVYYESEK